MLQQGAWVSLFTANNPSSGLKQHMRGLLQKHPDKGAKRFETGPWNPARTSHPLLTCQPAAPLGGLQQQCGKLAAQQAHQDQHRWSTRG